VEPGRTRQLPDRRSRRRFSARIDELTGKPLVDLVLDTAEQKGTGKWTSQESFDMGAPTPTINSAVVARIISSMKTERVAAAEVLPGPGVRFTGDRQALDRQRCARRSTPARSAPTPRAWQCCARPARSAVTT
jgi:hypothetical protein